MMRKYKQNSGNKLLYVLFSLIIFYFAEWVTSVISNSQIILIPSFVNMIIILGLFIWYMIKYRRNNILCFELVFIPLFALCLVFEDLILVLATTSVSGAFDNLQGGDTLHIKSMCVNMLGFLFFMLGLCVANNKRYITRKGNIDLKVNNRILDYGFLSSLLTIFVTVLFIYAYLTGAINTWFQYGAVSFKESNLYVGTLTRFLLMCTIFEFAKLSHNRVNTFKSFLRKSNKIYLIDILLITGLLIVSGNRSEALQILFPLIVAYSIFICPIKKRSILVGLVIMGAIMVVSGWSRGTGEMNVSRDNNLYEYTKDFGFVNINTEYLISYADKNGPDMFTNILIYGLSGIPFFGHVIVEFAGLDFRTSAQVTTDGLQVIGNDSGLGTSVIGDLYYTGLAPFVIACMFLLGFFLSRSYNKYYYEKNVNVWGLIFYLILMANCVYFIRDMWYRYLEIFIYDAIIISVLGILFQKKEVTVNIQSK